MNEPNTPAPSAPQTPITQVEFDRIRDNITDSYDVGCWSGALSDMKNFARTLELESAARQRVIDTIEREAWRHCSAGESITRILAIIADGKEGKV